MLEILRKYPILVILGSFSTACFVFASLLTTIVRNLIQLKDLPKKPTRFCTKKTGPFEVSLINNAIIGKSQLRIKTTTKKEKVTSKTLL
jgi:hypothetical protein